MNNIDGFFKIAVPVLGFLYFVYQVIAGTFFATTSIILEAERDPKKPELVIVKATIERGDNWLVDIEDSSINVLKTKNDTDMPYKHSEDSKLFMVELPHKEGTVLSLAPKEKTQTSFIIEDKDKSGFYLIAEIKYSQKQWINTATSFAKIYIPAAS